jgi:hypothetical protein
MEITRKALMSLLCVGLLFQGAAYAQTLRDDAETTIVENGYYVVPSYGGKYKVIIAVVAANPYEDKFASRPTVRVTARTADGAVITTREVSSAGIPPKGKIAFCDTLYADEMPAKVEFRPLGASYEATIYRASEFVPFELIGVRVRQDGRSRLRVTGEIKNPYPGETGAWITFLYRDAGGKLLGGHTKYESTIPAGEPTPFEFVIDSDEIPAGMKTIDRVIFNHNNYQSSWQKLLRR